MSDMSHLHGGLSPHLPPEHHPTLDELFPEAAADREAMHRAIADKAARLSAGEPLDRIQSDTSGGGVAGGYMYYQRFEAYTIFWSKQVGTFEIHGGIRQKYDAVDGVRLLGMPVTDESSCADGGRYNHFARQGSIYWHRQTGPYVVRGAIRDEWARRGWERGPLGFPVLDQLDTGTGPAALFQNGALSQQDGAVTDAAFAVVPGGQIAHLVWQTFDGLVRARGGRIRLLPGGTLDRVSPTGGALWRALNRTVYVSVSGTHGSAIATDANFTAHLGLRLTDVRHGDGAAGWDLVAELAEHSVEAYGVYGPITTAVRDGVDEAIRDAFREPQPVAAPSDPNRPTIPVDSGFIGAIVLDDGKLLLTFTNTVPGRIAALTAQRAIEALG